MSNQIKNKQIELIPDKDGFLFEIEDYNYLLNRFCGWIAVIIIISFILFYFFDGNILAMRNEGHRGYLLVTVGEYILYLKLLKCLFI